MDDSHLFAFDPTVLFDYEEDKARADLEKYGETFRCQLVAARHLSDWSNELADKSNPVWSTLTGHEIRGYVNALREVAAQLRLGYYLPGGQLYEEVERAAG